MKTLLKNLRRKWCQMSPEQVFTRHTGTAGNMMLRIRLFYALCLFVVCAQGQGVYALAKRVSIHGFDPLPPVSWMLWFDARHLVVYTLYVSLLLSCLYVTGFVWHRLARVMFFGAFFLFIALTNSFGKIGHGLHMLLWASFLLIFLPRGKTQIGRRRIDDQRIILVGQMVMLTTAMFYSLAGMWKVAGAIYQIYAGQIHAFHPMGMAGLLAVNLPSPFATWLIEHHHVAYLALMGVIIWEVASLPAALRPSWHRLWGLGLIAMHVGIFFALQINSLYSILLLTLFFVFTPFARSTTT